MCSFLLYIKYDFALTGFYWNSGWENGDCYQRDTAEGVFILIAFAGYPLRREISLTRDSLVLSASGSVA